MKTNLYRGRMGVVPPDLTLKSILEEKLVASLPHVAICLLGNFKGEGGVN